RAYDRGRLRLGLQHLGDLHASPDFLGRFAEGGKIVFEATLEELVGACPPGDHRILVLFGNGARGKHGIAAEASEDQVGFLDGGQPLHEFRGLGLVAFVIEEQELYRVLPALYRDAAFGIYGFRPERVGILHEVAVPSEYAREGQGASYPEFYRLTVRQVRQREAGNDTYHT